MNLDSMRNRMLNIILGSKKRIVHIAFKTNNRTFGISIPDDQYWGSVKDVLLNRVYEFDVEFELKNFNGLVVDAGAHVGLFSLVSSTFAREVISIEPDTSNYCLLKKNFERNKIRNALALNKALSGKKNRSLKLYKGADSGCNSIVGCKNRSFELTQSITLQQIIERFGKIDLLKMDIEGAEFEVIDSVEEDNLGKISSIVGELHLNDGNLHTFLKRLDASGFIVSIFRLPIYKKEWTYSIEVQGLYRLKFLHKIFHYIFSIIRIKEKNLLIFFAKQKKNNSTS